jgi:hypothetical protein
MAYADLNPVRSYMYNTPEASDHTSIKERIVPSFDLKKTTDDEIKQKRSQRFNLPLKPLAQFEGNVTSQEQIGILFRTDKRGAIPNNLPQYLKDNRLISSNGSNKASSLKSCRPYISLKSDET